MMGPLRRASLIAFGLVAPVLAIASCGGGSNTYSRQTIPAPAEAGLLWDIAIGEPGVPVMKFDAGLYRWDGAELVPVEPPVPDYAIATGRLAATPDGALLYGQLRLAPGASAWTELPPLEGQVATPTITPSGRLFAFVAAATPSTWTLHRLAPGADTWVALGDVTSETSPPDLFPDNDGVWFQLAGDVFRAEDDIAFAAAVEGSLVGAAPDGMLYLSPPGLQYVWQCGAIDVRTPDGRVTRVTDGELCVDDGYDAEVSCACALPANVEQGLNSSVVSQWLVGSDGDLYAGLRSDNGFRLNHLRVDLGAWEPVIGEGNGGNFQWRSDGPNFWGGGNTQTTTSGPGGVVAIFQTDLVLIERD